MHSDAFPLLQLVLSVGDLRSAAAEMALSTVQSAYAGHMCALIFRFE